MKLLIESDKLKQKGLFHMLTGNLRESFFERHLIVDRALSGVQVIVCQRSVLALLTLE